MIEKLIDILMLFKTDEKTAREKIAIFFNDLIENPREISDEFYNLTKPITWLSSGADFSYYFSSKSPSFHVFLYRDNSNKWHLIRKDSGEQKHYEFDTEHYAKIFAQNFYSVIILKHLFDQDEGLLNPKFFVSALTNETDEQLKLLKDALSLAGPIALHHYDTMSYPNFRFHYAKRQAIFDGMSIL